MKSALPPKIVFLDTETTGLSTHDRIISFAGILLETARLSEGAAQLDAVHLIFDPGRTSHPMAEKAHGQDDWTLRHQNPFSRFAGTVLDFINEADLVVAHNAEFDLKFINRELKAAGLSNIGKPSFCTMRAWRDRGNAGPATLDAVARQIGLAREGKDHSPLEDSWLAMMVYLSLHRVPLKIAFSTLKCPPTNWVEPAPRPAGPLPPRRAPAPVRAAERAQL